MLAADIILRKEREQGFIGRVISGHTARLLYHALRLLLVGIFLKSGISKAFNPGFFAESISAYGLLPDKLIVFAAISLISLEIVAALGLLAERRGALTLVSLMMALFVSVLTYGIFLGLDIDCGCFGPDDPEANAFHDLRRALFRDLLLMVAVVYLYVWRFVNRLIPRPWFRAFRLQAPNREE